MKWKDSPDKLWLSLRHVGLKTDYMTDTNETSSVVFLQGLHTMHITN